MSICLGHTSYVELAQVKFYKNFPPYSHCVWQKSSGPPSPSFARKNWMQTATLSGAETLAQQCLLSIVFKKSSGANSNCQKSMLRKTWISAERVFTNQPTCLWQGLFYFFKGWVSPLLSQPGLFLKIFILTWCFRPVTLGHLFQRLGHLRRSLRMASQVVFIGEMVYIYMTNNPCSWNNDIYIYMFSSCIFEYWLKPGRILAETSGKTKLLGVRSGEICTGWIWMVCFMLDGLQEANGHIQTQTQPECFQTCKLLIRNLTLTMKTTLWPWPYPWTSEKWGMLIGIRIPMRCKIDIAIPTATTNPYNPKYKDHWIRARTVSSRLKTVLPINITNYLLTVFVSPLFALPHFNY